MKEHKYTDEEVIKALKCCSKSGMLNCRACPYEASCNMGESKMQAHALDLINRQKAEISALTSAVDNSTQEFLKLHDKYQDQKAEIERLTAEKDTLIKTYKECMVEAIKEFAEKLEDFEEVVTSLKDGEPTTAVETYYIHKLVEEFTEEKT